MKNTYAFKYKQKQTSLRKLIKNLGLRKVLLI